MLGDEIGQRLLERPEALEKSTREFDDCDVHATDYSPPHAFREQISIALSN